MSLILLSPSLTSFHTFCFKSNGCLFWKINKACNYTTRSGVRVAVFWKPFWVCCMRKSASGIFYSCSFCGVWGFFFFQTQCDVNRPAGADISCSAKQKNGLRSQQKSATKTRQTHTRVVGGDLRGIMESAEKKLEDIFLQIHGADVLRHRRLCYFSFIMSKALKQRTSG